MRLGASLAGAAPVSARHVGRTDLCIMGVGDLQRDQHGHQQSNSLYHLISTS